MIFKKTVEYINLINENKFAGYSSWRLPTLEEAMSLVVEGYESWHISELFDTEQNWIWTSDLYVNICVGSDGRVYVDDESEMVGWGVFYDFGNCCISAFNYGYNVRAVLIEPVK